MKLELLWRQLKNQQTRMKKFEYRLLNPERSFFKEIDYKELTERLNHLGSQGWEVVTTVGVTVGGQTTSLLSRSSAKFSNSQRWLSNSHYG